MGTLPVQSSCLPNVWLFLQREIEGDREKSEENWRNISVNLTVIKTHLLKQFRKLVYIFAVTLSIMLISAAVESLFDLIETKPCRCSLNITDKDISSKSQHDIKITWQLIEVGFLMLRP